MSMKMLKEPTAGNHKRRLQMSWDHRSGIMGVETLDLKMDRYRWRRCFPPCSDLRTWLGGRCM